MRALIDANVVIDYVSNRKPFADDAERVFAECAKGNYTGLISAGEITTVFYVLRKDIGADATLAALRTIAKYVEIADVGKSDITKALAGSMPDFEDAVLAHSAKRAKADCIISRNTKDFTDSPVPAISPADFLKQNFNP